MSARSRSAPPLAGRARLLLLLLAAVALLAAPRPARAADGIDLTTATVAQLHGALADGRISCRALIAGELARIDAYDHRGPALNAVITVNPDALATAAALDAERASGAALRPAHCLPVLLKDNIETGGLRTTYGSGLFADFVPAADAPLVARLKTAGAVVLAKSNLDEFAAAVYGVSHMAGAMRNPYGLGRTTGGSSGGPAAGVAAGYAPLAIGTDTGGSLRIPAAFDSVVTIRPSTGLVSRAGMSPRALTQDTPGPLARTVADAAAGLDLIAGSDPADPATAAADGARPADGYAAHATPRRLDGVRLGIIRQGIPLWGDLTPELSTLEQQAVADLEAAGATVIDVPQAFVDRLDTGFGCGDCLLDSGVIGDESRRDLDAYLGGLAPRPPVTTLRALLASRALTMHSEESFAREVDVDVTRAPASTGYAERLARQDDLRAATVAELETLDLDAFVYPSANQTPDPIGDEQDGVFTRWSEQTGFPAIGVPMGYGSVAGLPASIEFLGRRFGEAELIEIAAGYEAASRRRLPPASAPATVVPFAQEPTPPSEPPTPAPPTAPPVVPPGRPAPPASRATPLRLVVRGAAIGDDGRRTTVRVTLSRRARLWVAVRSGRRTVATSAAASVGSGRRTVVLRLRRKVAPGAYTLTVSAAAGAAPPGTRCGCACGAERSPVRRSCSAGRATMLAPGRAVRREPRGSNEEQGCRAERSRRSTISPTACMSG